MIRNSQETLIESALKKWGKSISYSCYPNQTPIGGQFARVVITPLSHWSAVLLPIYADPCLIKKEVRW